MPLSVAELRRLLWRLVWQPQLSPAYLLNWSAWRRRHQAIAQFYHFKRRALAMQLRELLMVHLIEVPPEVTVAKLNYLLYVKMVFTISLLWLSTA
ncbi:MAG: hypothetical protein KME43_14915 [Myxacorys chilensis ATA2-1-KO14]|nr:hypothetical protein [Myxacorys chilensis ATA2-1-KO14]